MSVTIHRAEAAADFDAARRLIRQYIASLPFVLHFQDYERELAEVQTMYAPPHGALLIAEQDGVAIGCVAVRRFDEERCEMKRLYVPDSARGQGIGRALVKAVIDEGRVLGYRTMLLDTVDSMAAAIALYRSFGFRETAPYRFNPQPDAKYFELPLVSA